MPFTFPLPDPDSLVLDETVDEDGQLVVTATPELAALLEAQLQQQTDAIVSVVQSLAGAIGETLALQQGVIGAALGAIGQVIRQQQAGQNAALSIILQQVSEYVTTRIAQATEQVSLTATTAALLPRQPAPYPSTAPVAPTPVVPAPSPFLPGRPQRPGPFSNPQTAPSPAAPPPAMPTVRPASGGIASASPQQFMPVQTVSGFAPALQGQGEPGIIGGMASADETVRNLPSGYVFGGSAGSATVPPEPQTPNLNVAAEEAEREGRHAPDQEPEEEEPVPQAPDVVNVNIVNIQQAGAGPDEFAPPQAPPGQRPEPFGPPAPQAKPPVVVPPADCPWKIGDKFPPIGGPEWCRLQNAIAEGLAALGNQMINLWLDPMETIANGLATVVNGLKPAGVAIQLPGLNEATGGVLETAGKVINVIRQGIACWRQLASTLPQCQPGVLLGLVVLRGVVKLLKKIRLGTDFGVWATADMALDFPQIERATRYILESLCPSKIPGAGDAWGAYRAGFIDEQTMRCWSLADGVDPDLWLPIRQTAGQKISPEQVMLWSRLSGAGPEDADAGLIQRGWGREVDRNIVQALYDRFPTGEQWLHWEDVGALDQPVTDILLRDRGFQEFWTARPGQMAAAHGMTEEEGRYRWRAQQPLPGIGDLQQYLYRLRQDEAPPAIVMTEDRVRTILEAGNMAPAHVDWAMATIYRPLSVGDAVDQVRMGVAGPGYIEGAYRDAGYSPADAQRLARVSTAEAWRSYASASASWSLSTVIAMSLAGMPLPDNAVVAMTNQGYDEQTVRTAVSVAQINEAASVARRSRMRARQRSAQAALTAYQVGTIDAAAALATLMGAGYDQPSALAQIASIDLSQRAKAVQAAIKQVERGLMRGEISRVQAQQLLATGGVTAERIAQLDASWAVERAATRPMAPVGAIRKWVSEGLLSMDAARRRLSNMGWRDPDLTLMLSEMGSALAKAQATAQKKGAAAAQAAAKAADRVRQQALRRLERQRPVSALAQWYKDGLLGAEEIRARMRRYGYDNGSIDLYLRAWDHQRARRLTSATASAAKAPLTPQKQVPLSRVRAWYLDAIVDEAWARERLAGYGYDAEAIDGYIIQWNQQGEYRASRPKQPAPV